MPCTLVLVINSVGDLLDAVVGYLIQEGIGIRYDIQVTSAVGGGLGGEGQEVDVGLGEQVCNVLVEVKGELQDIMSINKLRHTKEK